MSIYQIFYVSSVTQDFKESDIDNILVKARKYNSERGITGVMLFRAGIFVQLLEGQQDEVDVLFSKIKEDKRHSNIIQLLILNSNERIFPDWSMSYKKLEEIDIKFINEILSWNRLISGAKVMDNNLILTMLKRFKVKLA